MRQTGSGKNDKNVNFEDEMFNDFFIFFIQRQANNSLDCAGCITVLCSGSITSRPENYVFRRDDLRESRMVVEYDAIINIVTSFNLLQPGLFPIYYYL